MSKESTKEISRIENKQLTQSERFTNMVLAEFGKNVGTVALTEFQRRLAQNYFIAVDAALKKAEVKRLAKSGKYRDNVPVVWENVTLEALAVDVVAYARIGLDPAQKNHINMIPYKNNNTQKYDIGFIEGYRGIELKAIKYALEKPDAVIVELVFSNDKFKVIKKSKDNPIETYEFEVINAFDRGEIQGGFYYHVYKNNPEKNKLVSFNIKDIEKRKPPHASVEFWGGEKDVWVDGKKTGKKEKVEGWYEEMCYKTVYRAAYNDITIDSQKIDDNYLRVKAIENAYIEAEVDFEIEENANKEKLDIKDNAIEVEGTVHEDEDGTIEEETETEPETEIKEQKSKSTDRKARNRETKEPETLMDMVEEGPGY